MMAAHRFIEYRAAIRILAEEFEWRRCESAHESSVAGANSIQELAPRLIQLLAVKPCVCPLTTVATQRIG
jgi:hypothetical protein